MLVRSSSLYGGLRRVAFCAVGAAALATACSNQGHLSVVPRQISTGSHATNVRSLKVRRHRLRPLDVPLPPSTVTGGVSGSYCYMTNGGTVQPGWWPVYACWIMQNDTIDFGKIAATPGLDSRYFCGPATWTASGISHAGPPSSMTYTMIPSVTGFGDWNCERSDIIKFKMSRGTDSGGWFEGGVITGQLIICTTINCAGPIGEIPIQLAVNPGPAPTPNPTAAPTSIGSPYPSPAPSTGLVIVDNNNGEAIVSDGTLHKSVVGLQMNLSAKKYPGLANPSSILWTSFGGPTFLSQTLSDSAASEVMTGPSPIPNNPAIYYWYVGNGEDDVIVSAVVNGNNMNAVARYSIETPTIASMNATVTVPTINPSTVFLELGSPSNPPLTAGIISNYSANNPADFSGYYAENQVIQSNPVTSPLPTAFPSSGPAHWADDCWIYNVDQHLNNNGPISGGPGGTTSYGPTYDAPGYGIADLTSISIDDSFIDSYMFRPSGANNAWVIFGQLSWAWGGLGTYAGSWSLTDKIYPDGPSGGTIHGSPTTALPSWPNRFGSDPCPTPPPALRVRDRSHAKILK